MAAPSRSSRHAAIRSLIDSHQIGSQAELLELLVERGFSVSQGTLSRDLLELGVIRVRCIDGSLAYAPQGSMPELELDVAWTQLAKLCAEMGITVSASANIAVVKTPPGAAQYFGSGLDKANWDAVLGTIAGDDTVMVICRDRDGGHAVAAHLAAMAKSGAVPAECVAQLTPTTK